jgi:hypothetical protein
VRGDVPAPGRLGNAVDQAPGIERLVYRRGGDELGGVAEQDVVADAGLVEGADADEVRQM